MSVDRHSGIEFFVQEGRVHIRINCQQNVVHFPNAPRLQSQKWYHIGLVHRHTRYKSSTATLYINGLEVDTTKVPYPNPMPTHSNCSHEAMIGIPAQSRRRSKEKWKMSGCYLFREPLSDLYINALFCLGPAYDQTFHGESGSGHISLENHHLNSSSTTTLLKSHYNISTNLDFLEALQENQCSLSSSSLKRLQHSFSSLDRSQGIASESSATSITTSGNNSRSLRYSSSSTLACSNSVNPSVNLPPSYHQHHRRRLKAMNNNSAKLKMSLSSPSSAFRRVLSYSESSIGGGDTAAAAIDSNAIPKNDLEQEQHYLMELTTGSASDLSALCSPSSVKKKTPTNKKKAVLYEVNYQFLWEKVAFGYNQKMMSSWNPWTKIRGCSSLPSSGECMGGIQSFSFKSIATTANETVYNGITHAFLLFELAKTPEQIKSSIQFFLLFERNQIRQLQTTFGILQYLLRSKAAVSRRQSRKISTLSEQSVSVTNMSSNDGMPEIIIPYEWILQELFHQIDTPSMINVEVLQYLILDDLIWQHAPPSVQQLLFLNVASALSKESPATTLNAANAGPPSRLRQKCSEIGFVRRVLYFLLNSRTSSGGVLPSIIDALYVYFVGNTGEGVKDYQEVADFLISTLSVRFLSQFKAEPKSESPQPTASAQDQCGSSSEASVSKYSIDNYKTIMINWMDRFSNASSSSGTNLHKAAPSPLERFSPTNEAVLALPVHYHEIRNQLLQMLLQVFHHLSSHHNRQAMIKFQYLSNIFSPKWIFHFLFGIFQQVPEELIHSVSQLRALKLFVWLFLHQNKFREEIQKSTSYLILLAYGLPLVMHGDTNDNIVPTTEERQPHRRDGQAMTVPILKEMWYYCFSLLFDAYPSSSVKHWNFNSLIQDFPAHRYNAKEHQHHHHFEMILIIFTALRRTYFDPLAPEGSIFLRKSVALKNQEPCDYRQSQLQKNVLEMHKEILQFLTWMWSEIFSFRLVCWMGSKRDLLGRILMELSTIICSTAQTNSSFTAHITTAQVDLQSYFQNDIAQTSLDFLITIITNTFFMYNAKFGMDLLIMVMDANPGAVFLPPFHDNLTLQFHVMIVYKVLQQMEEFLQLQISSEIQHKSKESILSLQLLFPVIIQRFGVWQKVSMVFQCSNVDIKPCLYSFFRLLILSLQHIPSHYYSTSSSSSNDSATSHSSSAPIQKHQKGYKRKKIKQFLSSWSFRNKEMEILLKTTLTCLHQVILQILSSGEGLHERMAPASASASASPHQHPNMKTILSFLHQLNQHFGLILTSMNDHFPASSMSKPPSSSSHPLYQQSFNAFLSCLCHFFFQYLYHSDPSIQFIGLSLWQQLFKYQSQRMFELVNIKFQIIGAAPYSINLFKGGFDRLLVPVSSSASSSDEVVFSSPFSPSMCNGQNTAEQPISMNNSNEIETNIHSSRNRILTQFKKWCELMASPIQAFQEHLATEWIQYNQQRQWHANAKWNTVYEIKWRQNKEKRERFERDNVTQFLALTRAFGQDLDEGSNQELRRQVQWKRFQSDQNYFLQRQWRLQKEKLMHHFESTSTTTSLRGADDGRGEWTLDFTEGPYRMRKKLRLIQPNHHDETISMKALSDEDDEIAGKIRSFFVPGDEILEYYDCREIDGLESYAGILCLCNYHLYMIYNYQLASSSASETNPFESSRISWVNGKQHTGMVHIQPITQSRNSNERIQPIINGQTCQYWAYSELTELHKRRYELVHVALELFARDGRNSFLTFRLSTVREAAFMSLLALCPNVHGPAHGLDELSRHKSIPSQHNSKTGRASSTSMSKPTKISGRNLNPVNLNYFHLRKVLKQTMTEKWCNAEISNFEYLMHLNTLAGRSFNDLNQYPVFPWIISDYHSDYESFDLTNPATYRDLSKPMGALYREEEFRLRFAALAEDTSSVLPGLHAQSKENLQSRGTLEHQPFHYGTHYSSAAIVLHYLIRLQPYTKLHQQLQGLDDKSTTTCFDHPDRLFSSIRKSWESAAGALPHQRKNTQDVRELIPEFFYLEHFLTNVNHCDFGESQIDGTPIDHVELPPWARGSPAEFIRLHRAALESDIVSKHLHHWIDLIFGYQQRGPEAEKVCNVFYPLTYEGAVDFLSEEASETTQEHARLQRAAYVDQINQYGQTPCQVFHSPHPTRRIKVTEHSSKTSSQIDAKHQRPGSGPDSVLTNMRLLNEVQTNYFGSLTERRSNEAAAAGDDERSMLRVDEDHLPIMIHSLSSFCLDDKTSNHHTTQRRLVPHYLQTLTMPSWWVPHEDQARVIGVGQLGTISRKDLTARKKPNQHQHEKEQHVNRSSSSSSIVAIALQCQLIPPHFQHYLTWGFPDRTLRLATIDDTSSFTTLNPTTYSWTPSSSATTGSVDLGTALSYSSSEMSSKNHSMMSHHFHPNTSRVVQMLDGMHPLSVGTVTDDGSLFLVGCLDVPVVQIFDLRTLDFPNSNSNHENLHPTATTPASKSVPASTATTGGATTGQTAPTLLRLSRVQDTLCSRHHSGTFITALAVSRVYQILVSACSDGTFILWDLGRRLEVRCLVSAASASSFQKKKKTCRRPDSHVQINDETGHIVIATPYHELLMFNVNGQILVSSSSPESSITSLAIHVTRASAWVDQHTVVTGHENGMICIWKYFFRDETADWKVLLETSVGVSSSAITALFLKPEPNIDEFCIISGNSEGHVYQWNRGG